MSRRISVRVGGGEAMLKQGEGYDEDEKALLEEREQGSTKAK